METGPDKSELSRADTSAIGAMLESERVAQNLTRKQVSDELNLSESIICALESDQEVSDISPTYIRGYQRAYVRLLGMDESTVFSDQPPVETVHKPQQNLHYFGKPMGLSRRKRNYGIWLKTALVIGLIAIVIAGWPKLISLFDFNSDEPQGQTVSQTDIQVFNSETAAGQDSVTETAASDPGGQNKTFADQAQQPSAGPVSDNAAVTTQVIRLANDLDQSEQLDNRSSETVEQAAPDETTDSPEAALSEAQTTSQSDQQTAAPSVNQQDSAATITFVSNGESWLSIADADDNRLYRNTLKLDRVSVTGELPLYVSTGNVRVLRLLAEQGEQQKVAIYNESDTVAKFYVNLDTEGRLVFSPGQ